MIHNNKHFYTSSEFIRWCYKEKYNKVETAELLREYFKMDNITIGIQMDLYYREER